MKFLLCFLLSLNLNAAASPGKTPLLITSFSVIQSLVEQIAPEDSNVQVLVPLESDPHDYKLSLQDIMKLKDVQMYFYFGHGVDDHLVTHQEMKNKCQVSRDLKLIQDKSNRSDPHAWQDPMMGILIGEKILKCLNQTFPDQKKQMQKNFKQLIMELKKISVEYRKLFEALPTANRKMITTHQAFQYLESPFQLQIYSLQGLHTHAEPSARSLQILIDQIKTQKIGFLFPEKPEISSTFKRLQSLTTIQVGPRLYSDTLSVKSGPAANYQNLLRHNLNTIYQALKTKDRL
jgi:zinc/manganese transport system substrate-binding protein